MMPAAIAGTLTEVDPNTESRAERERLIGERRTDIRQETPLWVSLCDLSGSRAMVCRADNIGEGGLHVRAPVGHGFGVGQRYEVSIGPDDAAGRLAPGFGQGHYVTVIRTQMCVSHRGDYVGVGLRFDQPIVL